MSASNTPNCAKCRHFFVTWDENFPRGCKAYGFRSTDYPSYIVHRDSGLSCQLFRKRLHDQTDEETDRPGRLVH